MFQLETEDMLPRMAPKPTAPTPMIGLNDDGGTVKPEVPEVSIIFGGPLGPQQQQQQQQQHQQQPQPSYATWRNQVNNVKHVENGIEDAIPSMGTAYPLPLNTYPLVSRSYSSPAGSSLATAKGSGTGVPLPGGLHATSSQQTISSLQSAYRSALPPVYYRHNNDPNIEYYLPSSGTLTSPSSITSRRSEILTICAGTQTDPITTFGNPINGYRHEYASKSDLEQLMKIIELMREDQIRLMQICESLLGMSQQTNQQQNRRNISIQCDMMRQSRRPNAERNADVLIEAGGKIYERPNAGEDRINMEDVVPEVEEKMRERKSADQGQSSETEASEQIYESRTRPVNRLVEQLKQQHQTGNGGTGGSSSSSSGILVTPKGRPVAQSTVYRINTPGTPVSSRTRKNTSPPELRQQVTINDRRIGGVLSTARCPGIREGGCNLPTGLPKPTTEKSLFMNELAIKYLPNDKLAELLQDINIDSVDGNHLKPLQSVENFVKDPTDLSNASYKYLKKYRLLPEDYMNAETLTAMDGDDSAPVPLPQRYQNAGLRECVQDGGTAVVGDGKRLTGHRHHHEHHHLRQTEGNGLSPLYREQCLQKSSKNHHRLPTSPLALNHNSSDTNNSYPISPRTSPMLDLDDIKKQPKLL